MNKIRVAAPLLLVVMTGLATPTLAVKKGQAKFMGGTIKTVAEKSEGPIDLSNEKRLTFIPKSGAILEIPWARISELEYGQKVARRWRSAILLNPFALLSKARKHFVTISYRDQDKTEQAVVLEFDGDDIRIVLASLKARTHKEIVIQDEEARKQLGGGTEKQ